MTMGTRSTGLRAVLFATVVTVAGAAGGMAWADRAPTGVVTVPANVLSVGDIESRLGAQGIKVEEIKVRDLLAEVEGHDAQGREIEVVIDRRSGEMLSHEYDH